MPKPIIYLIASKPLPSTPFSTLPKVANIPFHPARNQRRRARSANPPNTNRPNSDGSGVAATTSLPPADKDGGVGSTVNGELGCPGGGSPVKFRLSNGMNVGLIKYP